VPPFRCPTVTHCFQEEVLERAGKLKVVGRAGTGVDTINVDACTKRGVLVLNTPGGNTTSTAELTMSLMMNMLRSVPSAVVSAKSGKWERSKFMGAASCCILFSLPLMRMLSCIPGAEAFEKTLGVIGCGRIGRQVAHYAQAFGMKPIGCDAFVTAEEMKDAGLEKVDLNTLLKRADVITIHTPGGKDTKNMIGKDQLALCKDGVYIVNAARGGLINEAALLEALQAGKVPPCSPVV
jgi:D-3-phosphoglycerate dehydrogenase / 2-oxoglutarate reductase